MISMLGIWYAYVLCILAGLGTGLRIWVALAALMAAGGIVLDVADTKRPRTQEGTE